jgi:hypothetical protein
MRRTKLWELLTHPTDISASDHEKEESQNWVSAEPTPRFVRPLRAVVVKTVGIVLGPNHLPFPGLTGLVLGLRLARGRVSRWRWRRGEHGAYRVLKRALDRWDGRI